MEAVILNTVWVGTIHYTSGIMKSRIENLYNIFDNYEARSRCPLWVNGSSPSFSGDRYKSEWTCKCSCNKKTVSLVR